VSHHRQFQCHRTGVPVLLLAVLSSPALLAQDEAESKGLLETGTYLGANRCYDCHQQPSIRYYRGGVLDWCLMTEFSTWRTVDKHSMAYAVLEGPRGQEMGQKLGVDVTEPESGCLSCHAQNFPEQLLDPNFSFRDGVNCGVCHGPAGEWMTPHATASWRQNTPEQKLALGMRDLRNPEVQSELCLSCHIGNAELGRVISHPMYAAGHPPLPSIDVARFIKNMPQHWRDKDEVPWWDDAPPEIREANGIAPDKLYEVELAMIGNIVALRESMELLASRADVEHASKDELQRWPELAINDRVRNDPRFDDPTRFPALAQSRWPEMAMTHADCLACHHELRDPAWRQERGFVATPGRPMPRSFPLNLLEISIAEYGKPGDRERFDLRLAQLYEAFDARPFGVASEVRDTANDLADWADRFYRDRLRDADFTADRGPILARRLCEQNRDAILDYDSARQIASALQIIYRDWSDRQERPIDTHEEIEAILDSWDTSLNLGRYPKSEERDELSLRILRDLADDPELNGFAAWVPARLEYPRDPSVYWEASRDNPILNAFRNIVAPDQLRQAYVSDEFRVPLQRINNTGLRIALENASRYDPSLFSGDLRRLYELLPEPGGSP